MYPGRCGTCTHFPGNRERCKLDTNKRRVIYALDNGKGTCQNYKEKQ